jgi:hypothetical protein
MGTNGVNSGTSVTTEADWRVTMQPSAMRCHAGDSDMDDAPCSAREAASQSDSKIDCT